jgi:signal transduction histidine kinase
MSAMWSRALLRVVFLLLGGAVSLALLVLYAGFAILLWRWRPDLLGAALIALLAVVPVSAVGMVPAVRDLEITAARAMLGTDAEMVQSPRPTGQQRRRSSAWVWAHLLAGTLVGTLLFIAVPSLVVSVADLLQGREETLVLGRWDTGVGQAGSFALVAVGVLAALAAGPLVGAGLARLAPALLGPSAADRLSAAQERVGQLVERGRLARDLHDGVGHALSVISLQSAAGRRVLDHDPAFTREALTVVEDTARAALDELDAALGALRDGPAPTAPQLGLDDVDLLVQAHAAGGTDVRLELDLGRDVPGLVSHEAYRIVQEGLTNAVRHAQAPRIDVTVRTSVDELAVEVVNPLGAPEGRRRSRARGGRGLAGIQERTSALGGHAAAGAADGCWRLRAVLPLPEVRS